MPASRQTGTHYFWEFLLLFLAVFCGFLAEYQLEHKIEKEREKQFLRSLVNDLKVPLLLNEFVYMIRYKKANSAYIYIGLEELKRKAGNLIAMITKAYHLA